MIPAPSNLKAALWVAGSIACFLLMSIAGRETTEQLNVFQVMEFRAVIGLLILMPMVFWSGGLGAMRTKRPFLHIARNVAHYTGQASWLYALTLIPLGQLIAIEFTTPIWTALLAVLFLGERLTRPRIGAIALGLLGVVVIVRPGAAPIETGHLVVLFAAFTFGISVATAKALTRTDSVVCILFWMLLVQSIVGFAPALYVWRTPTPELWPWIVLIGFSGMASHFCLTRALACADATVVSPMDMARVPLSALLGWLLYNEQIDVFTAIGAALVLSGNLLNIQRRQRPEELAVDTPPSG